jgi:ABC transporter DrrB family efflux protein
MQTAIGLNTDLERGIVDRLRSLPITRLAPVGGRIAADAVRVVVGSLIVAGFGVLLGFRSHTPATHTLAALGLVIGFGVAMCWPMALVGIWLRSPEAVQTTAFLLVLPLTFASSVFAPLASMPGWLQAFVTANPVTAAVDATRGLLLGGPVADPTSKAVAWITAITVVFALLATDRYRRRA